MELRGLMKRLFKEITDVSMVRDKTPLSVFLVSQSTQSVTGDRLHMSDFFLLLIKCYLYHGEMMPEAGDFRRLIALRDNPNVAMPPLLEMLRATTLSCEKCSKIIKKAFKTDWNDDTGTYADYVDTCATFPQLQFSDNANHPCYHMDQTLHTMVRYDDDYKQTFNLVKTSLEALSADPHDTVFYVCEYWDEEQGMVTFVWVNEEMAKTTYSSKLALLAMVLHKMDYEEFCNARPNDTMLRKYLSKNNFI